jgi:hypothetical protein
MSPEQGMVEMPAERSLQHRRRALRVRGRKADVAKAFPAMEAILRQLALDEPPPPRGFWLRVRQSELCAAPPRRDWAVALRSRGRRGPRLTSAEELCCSSPPLHHEGRRPRMLGSLPRRGAAEGTSSRGLPSLRERRRTMRLPSGKSLVSEESAASPARWWRASRKAPPGEVAR